MRGGSEWKSLSNVNWSKEKRNSNRACLYMGLNEVWGWMLLNAAVIKIQPDLIPQSRSTDVLLHKKLCCTNLLRTTANGAKTVRRTVWNRPLAEMDTLWIWQQRDWWCGKNLFFFVFFFTCCRAKCKPSMEIWRWCHGCRVWQDAKCPVARNQSSAEGNTSASRRTAVASILLVESATM